MEPDQGTGAPLRHQGTQDDAENFDYSRQQQHQHDPARRGGHQEQYNAYQEQDQQAASDYDQQIDDQNPQGARATSATSAQPRKSTTIAPNSRAMPFVSSPRAQRPSPVQQQQQQQQSQQQLASAVAALAAQSQQQDQAAYANANAIASSAQMQQAAMQTRSLSPPPARHMLQSAPYAQLYVPGNDPNLTHHMGMLGAYGDQMLLQQQMMQRQQQTTMQELQQVGMSPSQQQQQQQQLAQQHALASAGGPMFYAAHRPLLLGMGQDAWAAGAMQMGLPAAAHMAAQMMDPSAAAASLAGQGSKGAKSGWASSPRQTMAGMAGMQQGYMGQDPQALMAAAAAAAAENHQHQHQHQQSQQNMAAAAAAAAAAPPPKKKPAKRQRADAPGQGEAPPGQGQVAPPGPPGMDASVAGADDAGVQRQSSRSSVKAVPSALPGTKAVAQSTNKPLTSRFRGVCWNKKNRRWQAAINSGGKYLYLGSFVSEDEAARAFDRAAIKLRNKKAKLNFTYEEYVDADGNLLQDVVLPEPSVGPGQGRNRQQVQQADEAAAAAAAAAQTMAPYGTLQGMMTPYGEVDLRQAGQQVTAASALDDPMWNLGMGAMGAMHMSAMRGMSLAAPGYPAAALGDPQQLMMMPAAAAAAAAAAAGLQLAPRPLSSSAAAAAGGGAVPTASFPSVMSMLPASCHLENIIPGRFDSMAVLYRNKESDQVGASIWDGLVLQHLGMWASEGEATQAAQAALNMLTMRRSGGLQVDDMGMQSAAMGMAGLPMLAGLQQQQQQQQQGEQAGEAAVANVPPVSAAMAAAAAGGRSGSHQDLGGFAQQANPLHMLAAASGMVSQGGAGAAAAAAVAVPPGAYRQNSLVSTDMRRAPSFTDGGRPAAVVSSGAASAEEMADAGNRPRSAAAAAAAAAAGGATAGEQAAASMATGTHGPRPQHLDLSAAAAAAGGEESLQQGRGRKRVLGHPDGPEFDDDDESAGDAEANGQRQAGGLGQAGQQVQQFDEFRHMAELSRVPLTGVLHLLTASQAAGGGGGEVDDAERRGRQGGRVGLA